MAVALTSLANACAGRLDEEIAAKEEFKKQQGVLAQQFFTQKLRLRATQEKEWTKFNKMCTSRTAGVFASLVGCSAVGLFQRSGGVKLTKLVSCPKCSR